jgi:hypothetical protein
MLDPIPGGAAALTRRLVHLDADACLIRPYARERWHAAEPYVLREWIRENPGTRPLA